VVSHRTSNPRHFAMLTPPPWFKNCGLLKSRFWGSFEFLSSAMAQASPKTASKTASAGKSEENDRWTPFLLSRTPCYPTWS
jgi:hypothetical protein